MVTFKIESLRKNIKEFFFENVYFRLLFLNWLLSREADGKVMNETKSIYDNLAACGKVINETK